MNYNGPIRSNKNTPELIDDWLNREPDMWFKANSTNVAVKIFEDNSTTQTRWDCDPVHTAFRSSANCIGGQE